MKSCYYFTVETVSFKVISDTIIFNSINVLVGIGWISSHRPETGRSNVLPWNNEAWGTWKLFWLTLTEVNKWPLLSTLCMDDMNCCDSLTYGTLKLKIHCTSKKIVGAVIRIIYWEFNTPLINSNVIYGKRLLWYDSNLISYRRISAI